MSTGSPFDKNAPQQQPQSPPVAPDPAPAAAPPVVHASGHATVTPQSIPAGEMTAFDAQIDAAFEVATGTTATIAAAFKTLGAAVNDDAGGLEYGAADIRLCLEALVDAARDLGAAGRHSS